MDSNGVGGSSKVPEKAVYDLPDDDIILVPNLSSPWFDIGEFLNVSDHENIFNASLPSRNASDPSEPATVEMADQPEVVVVEKVVKTNTEVVAFNNHNTEKVVTCGGVINDENNDRSNLVVDTGVVTNDVNNEVAARDCGGDGDQGVKRKRGRPRKLVQIKDSVVPVSSPSMGAPSRDLPVANEGSSVNRGRERLPRACKNYKAAAVIPCSGSHNVSGSSKEPKAGATVTRSRDINTGSRKEVKAAVTTFFPLSPEISGSAGSEFLVHVITLRPKEDVLRRLLSFSRVKKQAVCVLSAEGTICNVALRQSSSPGGTVTYQGRFMILSLSGSFLPSESGSHHSTTGGLSVLLAGPNGRVLGGGVAGLLTAASVVQIIVGTFLAA